MPAGLPNYLPTAYTDAIIRFSEESTRFEFRKDKYGALAAYIASSPFLLSQGDVSREKRSFERPFKIPVIKRMSITLKDGRTCVIGGQEPTTDAVALTFSVKGFEIKVPRALLDQNYIRYNELLTTALYFAWHKWYEFMETNCLSFLAANKSTALVDDASTQAYFTKSGAAYTGVQGAPFYAAYNYVLGRNILNAGTDFLDVTNGAAMVTQRLMGMNGAGNAVNQAMLLTGGATMYPTNFLVPDAGYAETHYMFTPGAVGIYHWLSPNAANNVVFEPQKDFWFSERDPMFNYFDASVHYQAACAEQTVGYNGAVEPVYYDKYEYTVDTSMVKSYSSVEGESPIIKYNLAPAA
ncbi:hypothetical protein GGR92_005264 [Spirosoma lacussanchae]|uniref:hypothetical protein n=1 Tax=Spirosoma lacussanchae TaxID=1884249 RepID=UPI001107E3F4|nr:hypothetical protein [Spirosoma lacussanchae]